MTHGFWSTVKFSFLFFVFWFHSLNVFFANPILLLFILWLNRNITNLKPYSNLQIWKQLRISPIHSINHHIESHCHQNGTILFRTNYSSHKVIGNVKDEDPVLNARLDEESDGFSTAFLKDIRSYEALVLLEQRIKALGSRSLLTHVHTSFRAITTFNKLLKTVRKTTAYTMYQVILRLQSVCLTPGLSKLNGFRQVAEKWPVLQFQLIFTCLENLSMLRNR